MVKNRDRVESVFTTLHFMGRRGWKSNKFVGAALAEHIGQSRFARVQQNFVNLELLDAQSSAREKEIISWLAPAAYDVDYYMNDLAIARSVRHPKTCQWVFEREEFAQFSDDFVADPDNKRNRESFLWIYAKPGMT